jgi:hypothetical protein
MSRIARDTRCNTPSWGRISVSHLMKLPSDDQFSESMSPVTSRLTKHKWEVARHTSLGGAGVSVAVLLVVSQIGVATPALWLSLFCSAVAIPVWATLWQVGEAYSFYGVRPVASLSLHNGLTMGMLLFLAGGLLLLLSIFMLIWHFSVAAAFAFLFVSVGGVFLTVRHHAVVRSQASSSNGNGG